MATHRVHWALNVEAPDSRSAAEIAWTQVLGQSPKPTTDDHCVFYVQPVRTPGDKPRKPGFVDLSTSPSSDIVDLAERRRTVVTPTDKAFLLDTMNDAADLVLDEITQRLGDKPSTAVTDLVNLLVSTAATLAEKPGAGLTEVLADNYSYDEEEAEEIIVGSVMELG